MSGPYRWVSRAYPADYRDEHLGEIVATAADLAPGGWSFRQSRSLLAAGLRTRALAASEGSSTELWASGVRLALFLWFLMPGAITWSEWVHGTTGYTNEAPVVLILAYSMLPLLVMLLTTRWPLVIAVSAVTAWSLSLSIGDGSSGWSIWHEAAWVGVIAGMTLIPALFLALRGDGRPVARPWGPIALAITLLAATLANLTHDGYAEHLMAAIYLGTVVIGIVLLAVDPRVFVAATLLWVVHSLSISAGVFDTTSQVALAITTVAGTAAVWGIRRSTRNLLPN